MEDTGLVFQINWVSAPIFLVLAIAIALYAKRVSGGWVRPWIGIKPLWWFPSSSCPGSVYPCSS